MRALVLASSLFLAACGAIGGGSGDGGGGGGGADGGGGGDPEPAGLEGITRLHNEVRASVGVGPLTWDPQLAQIAQSWAEACVDNAAPAGLIDHNAGRSDTYPEYVGENIYGTTATPTPEDAVTAWADEAQYYDIASNTCSRVCGHYTQVVWAETTKVGCGVNRCQGLTYGGVIVCDYAVGGNMVGERPYPYP